jgi:hypothetical protein
MESFKLIVEVLRDYAANLYSIVTRTSNSLSYFVGSPCTLSSNINVQGTSLMCHLYLQEEIYCATS